MRCILQIVLIVLTTATLALAQDVGNPGSIKPPKPEYSPYLNYN